MIRSKNIIAVPPGATIKEQLKDRGMSQKEFASRMEMTTKHISQLLNGEVRLTPDVAVRLELVLGVPASFWSNLEATYREKVVKANAENNMDEDKELSKLFPYNEMSKLGWVPKTNALTERVMNLRKFFENLEKNKANFSDDDIVRTNTFNKSSSKITESLLQKNRNSLMKLENNNALKLECEKISYKYSTNGFLNFGNNFLIFQTNKKFDTKQYSENPDYLLGGTMYDLNQDEKQIIIPYNSISQILNRNFLFHDIAVEIFLKNGKSYYFNFYKKNYKTEFIKAISKKINEERI